MSSKVSIDGMADVVMKALTEYSEAATTDVKKAVRKAGNLVRKEISQGAPSDRGKYAKSWSTKTSGETAASLELTVYSRMPGLPHLLEYGHAKRGGGRTAARPHIAPVEKAGEKQLMSDIERALKK